MFNIEVAEKHLDSIKDATIKGCMTDIVTTSRRIDSEKIRLLCDLQVIFTRLEGNTDGLPTKPTEFLSRTLGVKKAEQHNIITATEYVTAVYDAESKKHIFTDKFTAHLAFKKSGAADSPDTISDVNMSQEQWKKYTAELRRKKPFGMTAINTIVRFMNSKEGCTLDYVCELIDSGKISAAMSISKLKAAFADLKAIESNETKETTTETAETTTETAETTTETTAETTAETKTDITIPIAIAKNAYPVIARYAEESKELASLLHYLNGFPEIVG